MGFQKPPLDLEVTCNGFAYAPLHHGWIGPDSRISRLSEVYCPVSDRSLRGHIRLIVSYRTHCYVPRALQAAKMWSFASCALVLRARTT